MTQQETFDLVAKHLLTQNAKALDEAGCCYRNPAGKKCAAGCLIPDEHYSPLFERKSLEPQCNNPNNVTQKIIDLGHDVALVRALQVVHDCDDVEEWRDGLKRVADEYDLEWKFEEFEQYQ